jgi:hypothetical protein
MDGSELELSLAILSAFVANTGDGREHKLEGLEGQ